MRFWTQRRTSLPKAIKIGELLAGIKDKLEHGQWLPWIQKNLSFSERTAQNYLRFFEEKDRLKNAAIADLPLSVSGALALLSEPKASPEPPLDAANEARAAELDAKIKNSLAGTKAAFADVPRSEFPEDWIDLAAYEEFFKSGGQSLGTTLTPGRTRTDSIHLEFVLQPARWFHGKLFWIGCAVSTRPEQRSVSHENAGTEIFITPPEKPFDRDAWSKKKVEDDRIESEEERQKQQRIADAQESGTRIFICRMTTRPFLILPAIFLRRLRRRIRFLSASGAIVELVRKAEDVRLNWLNQNFSQSA